VLLDSWEIPDPNLVFTLQSIPDDVLSALVRFCPENDNPLSIEIIQHSLLATGNAHPRALDACAAVVAYVRRVRNLEKITPEQRCAFLMQLEPLRTTIRSIALARASLARDQGHTCQAREIELQLLGWCEALEHRLLVERFVELTGGYCVPDVPLPANLRPDNWPFTRELEPASGESLGGSGPACSLGCLDGGESAGRAPPAPPAELPPGRPGRTRALRDRCAGERLLPELIPEGVVWVRALFAPDQSLRWWAVRRGADGRLVVLADANGLPDTCEEIRQANDRFDRTVEDVWLAYQYGRLPIDLETWNLLCQFSQWAADPPEDRQRRLALAQLERPVRAFLERWRACAPLFAGGPELACQTRQYFHDAFQGRSFTRTRASKWVENLAALRGGGTLPRLPINPERERARRLALNQASEEHLKTIQKMFDLSGLWKAGQAAGLSWQDTDFLFTVQGPLWHAPLAWLDFGGKPLFQQVASTSKVVSLTLRDLVEEETDPSPNLLSVHWLPEEDRPHLLGLPHLHAELRHLGKRYGWQVWGLGYDPEARVPIVQAALAGDEPRFSMAVVGGHGDARHGVRLAGLNLFGGPEGPLHTDLSGLDLLLLVACAVGRVQQTGDRDVEGLYTWFAAHGGRSVIAAGWKVADREAATLAAEVVRQYLRAPPGAFRRARALNQARRQMLLPCAGEPSVSWHLASAFEIYGRG
jgi:hypothetical protein